MVSFVTALAAAIGRSAARSGCRVRGEPAGERNVGRRLGPLRAVNAMLAGLWPPACWVGASWVRRRAAGGHCFSSWGLQAGTYCTRSLPEHRSYRQHQASWSRPPSLVLAVGYMTLKHSTQNRMGAGNRTAPGFAIGFFYFPDGLCGQISCACPFGNYLVFFLPLFLNF